MQGTQVYIYKSGGQYTLVEGYPKSLQEELGVSGTVDAAFVCPGQHTLHIIQGKSTLGHFLSDNNDNISKKQTKTWIHLFING